MVHNFDLCVIGGGPAGYAAAMRAIDLNKRVLLVEKNKIGGAGLYNGALSSKTFWEISNSILEARKTLGRYSAGKIDVQFSSILNKVQQSVLLRGVQLETHLHLLRKNKSELFEFVDGAASITGKNNVTVDSNGVQKTFNAENILIATGSSPRKLPSIPIDEETIVTSDGIESFKEFPESLVILGAGVIGCEWATIFSNFGYTKVFIIDKAERILPFEDEDISYTVQRNMEERGVTIHRNAKLERMEKRDGKVEYELSYPDGTKEIHLVEKALISIGRVANTAGLGLENAGVQVSKDGTVVNTDTQTTVSNIYAAGDITADYALANVAELEGRHAVEKMFGLQPKKLSYANISTIMFLHPETAGVGMNEQETRKKGIGYKVVSIDYSLIPRALAMGMTEGFFKIIVTDDEEMKILGMRAVGEHASSAIQAVALLISMDKGIEELAELIHPHPSIIEGIQECVRMLKGKSILKPYIFKDTLKCRLCAPNGNSCDLLF